MNSILLNTLAFFAFIIISAVVVGFLTEVLVPAISNQMDKAELFLKNRSKK